MASMTAIRWPISRERFDKLTFSALARRLKVMDSTAFSCMDNRFRS